jgi:hypothetical protein
MRFSFLFFFSMFPSILTMSQPQILDLSFLSEFRVQGLWETCTDIERYTYLIMNLAHLPVKSTFSPQLVCELESWERQNISIDSLVVDGRLHPYLSCWFENICTAVDTETNYGFAMSQQVWDAWSMYQHYMFRLLPPSLD